MAGPKIITPDKNGNGIHNLLTIGYDFDELLTTENRDGVEIIGKYNLLNLAGARILAGQLAATVGSEADSVILSGAYVPDGIDLRWLYVAGRLNAQGIWTSDLLVGHISDCLDATASNVNGSLDLSMLGPSIDVSLRDGKFDLLD